MPKIGAHVSAAVSLERSFDKALEIGAECTQIFISPPQQWLQTKHDEKEIERYRKKAEETGIGPNFIHGTYLINLGTENPEHLKRSIEWLSFSLDLADRLNSQGVIFHLGSHKGLGFNAVLDQVVKALSHALISSKSSSLILETSAGAGGNIGGKFSELGKILKAVGNKRVKIGLDTQHVFAAGYDIKTPMGLRTTLDEFEEEIGLTNLAIIHANDSKVELGSGKDRHENIGEGFIRKEGFANLINNKYLQEVPFILEVPGFSGNGPDTDNVQILKSLRLLNSK